MQRNRATFCATVMGMVADRPSISPSVGGGWAAADHSDQADESPPYSYPRVFRTASRGTINVSGSLVAGLKPKRA